MFNIILELISKDNERKINNLFLQTLKIVEMPKNPLSINSSAASPQNTF